jgi:hypothetical protein
MIPRIVNGSSIGQTCGHRAPHTSGRVARALGRLADVPGPATDHAGGMTESAREGRQRPPLWRRLLPAFGLLLFAPIGAEYLYGYDDSTGDLAALAGGMVLFGPLYGGAALIIREVARRTGRGWPTILLLGLAFGVLQAGLIDHSMFNPSYREIEYWDELFTPTFVPALGVSLAPAVAFTTGHMIWSIAVPIAMIEALDPGRRTIPWLGRLGLGIAVAGFGLAAWVVVEWHLETEDFLPTAGQLAGAAAVVAALVGSAFALTTRPLPASERPTAGPWLVGAAGFGLLLARTPAADAASSATDEWVGFAVETILLGVLALLVIRWSTRAGWGPLHQLALAGGALLSSVVTAFATEPIGDVSTTAKYAHNVVALSFVIVLIAGAVYRLRKRAPQPATDAELVP